jgi:hypothetical protein
MRPNGVLVVPKYKLLAHFLGISADCLKVRYVLWSEMGE